MDHKFRTEINLKKGDFPEISYFSRIFLIGSCFSQEIGRKFREFKFQVLTNPFGVTYNPVSLSGQIIRITSKNYFKKEDFFAKGETFNSFELHGSFDNNSADELLSEVNGIVSNGFDFLSKSTHLYITLGTAWVYQSRKTSKIVNNCHKLPSADFTKSLLDLQLCTDSLREAIHSVRAINTDVKIIFTISPVRHLNDGFAENNLSKSLLRLSINQLMNEKDVFYFPSYEILMDDLRDYRFYKEDMIHPGDNAINYIWDTILQAQLSTSAEKIKANVETLLKSLNHKPFNEASAGHQLFLRKALESAENLQNKFADIDLSDEIRALKARLTSE